VESPADEPPESEEAEPDDDPPSADGLGESSTWVPEYWSMN
jgi:hypothetical protein